MRNALELIGAVAAAVAIVLLLVLLSPVQVDHSERAAYPSAIAK